MSDAVGPMFLGGQTEVFIGKDWGHTRDYSENLAARIDDETKKILDEQYRRAKEIIGADLEALDRVSAMLVEYERVTGEQFRRVYDGEDAAAVMADTPVPWAQNAPSEKQADTPAEPEPEAGEASSDEVPETPAEAPRASAEERIPEGEEKEDR